MRPHSSNIIDKFIIALDKITNITNSKETYVYIDELEKSLEKHEPHRKNDN